MHRHPAQTLHRSRSQRPEGRVAKNPTELKHPHRGGAPLPRRLANAGARSTTHSNAVRATGQAHQQGGCCESCLHSWNLEDFGKPGTRTVSLQIAVKHHGHSTYKKPAFGRHLYPCGLELD